MHLRSLKIFCDVAGKKSFSRAADDNGLTQSGASQLVHQLEERLGVKLIDRSQRPFVLTQEGEIFYSGCREIVGRYSALEEEVRSLRSEIDGRVQVASIYSVGLSHMNRQVQAFMSNHPKCKVRIQYQHPEKVLELVQQGQVDLGLVSYPRSTKHVKATTWRVEPMVLVAAPSHEWAKRSEVAFRELHGRDLVGFDARLRIREELDKTFAAHGVEVNYAQEFDNVETIKRAVEINMGLALLPEPTVEQELRDGSLHKLRIADIALWRPVGILQRRGRELGRAAKKFLEQLHASAELQSPNTELANPQSIKKRIAEEPVASPAAR